MAGDRERSSDFPDADTVPPEALRGTCRAPALSDRPVFIVGSPRSGTSIMCQTIDAHPNIFAPYWETGLFVRYEDMLTNHLAWVLANHRASFPLDREAIVAWIRDSVERLFARFAAACGKERWAEKTPAHVFHVELIHEVFPKAQFVHMIRNGRDVVRSLQNMSWAPRQIRWSVKRWIQSVEAGRSAGAKLPADQYLEVRFEEFIDRPEPTLRTLCSFLGEPFSPQMLASHEPANNSWHYPFEPLQDKPTGRYRPLSAPQRLVFNWYAKPLMRRLGYR